MELPKLTNGIKFTINTCLYKILISTFSILITAYILLPCTL